MPELGTKFPSREFLGQEISKSQPSPLRSSQLTFREQPTGRPSFSFPEKSAGFQLQPGGSSLATLDKTGAPSSMGLRKAQPGCHLPLPQSPGLANWICWVLLQAQVSRGSGTINHGFAGDGETFREARRNHVCSAMQMIGVSGEGASLAAAGQITCPGSPSAEAENRRELCGARSSGAWWTVRARWCLCTDARVDRLGPNQWVSKQRRSGSGKRGGTAPAAKPPRASASSSAARTPLEA